MECRTKTREDIIKQRKERNSKKENKDRNKCCTSKQHRTRQNTDYYKNNVTRHNNNIIIVQNNKSNNKQEEDQSNKLSLSLLLSLIQRQTSKSDSLATLPNTSARLPLCTATEILWTKYWKDLGSNNIWVIRDPNSWRNSRTSEPNTSFCQLLLVFM